MEQVICPNCSQKCIRHDEDFRAVFGREASKEEVYGMKYHSYGSIAMLVEWLRGDLSSPR